MFPLFRAPSWGVRISNSNVLDMMPNFFWVLNGQHHDRSMVSCLRLGRFQSDRLMSRTVGRVLGLGLLGALWLATFDFAPGFVAASRRQLRLAESSLRARQSEEQASAGFRNVTWSCWFGTCVLLRAWLG